MLKLQPVGELCSVLAFPANLISPFIYLYIYIFFFFGGWSFVICFEAVIFISLPGWSFWALVRWCVFSIVCLVLASSRSFLLPYDVGVLAAVACNYTHHRWQLQERFGNNFSCLIWCLWRANPLCGLAGVCYIVLYFRRLIYEALFFNFFFYYYFSIFP